MKVYSNAAHAFHNHTNPDRYAAEAAERGHPGHHQGAGGRGKGWRNDVTYSSSPGETFA